MTENTTPNSTALHSAISRSAIVHVMNQENRLGAIRLVRNSHSGLLQSMQDFFQRFRRLRGKSHAINAYSALQNSWCALIRSWNWMLEDGRSFTQWLANREDLRADHSIVALCEKICEYPWSQDRLYFNEGCRSCESCHVHLVTTGIGISLSAHSVNVDKF